MGRQAQASKSRVRQEPARQNSRLSRESVREIRGLPSGRRANSNDASPDESPRHQDVTGREVSFGTEEIIVSKTDIHGRITYANEIFLQVSGFTEDEVVGQPHSFIRHPDMPRCVFKMLWDAIQGGREIFAYVVNLTKNGDHYWVLAHVTPTFDERGMVTGYHSMRRCPERSQVERIKGVYARLLAEERMHARKTDAIAASLELLNKMVKEHATSYEEFVFSI